MTDLEEIQQKIEERKRYERQREQVRERFRFIAGYSEMTEMGCWEFPGMIEPVRDELKRIHREATRALRKLEAASRVPVDLPREPGDEL